MDMRRSPMHTAQRSDAPAPLWTAASQLLVLYAGSTLLTPLYRLYEQTFGFSRLTLIYAAYVLGNLTALLLLGRLSDQIGRRAVNLGALGAAALATLLFLAASLPALLFAGRIVSGMAIGLGASASTAWLAELTPDKRRATVFATVGNFVGLAAGALAAGVLAAYLPWPLRLSYVVYLIVLCGEALLLSRAPETVSRVRRSVARLSMRPRLGLPRELYGRFVAPAAIGFATFAVIGYYAALVPSLMGQSLNQPSPVAGAAMVALLCVVGAVTGIISRGLAPRTAMLAGSALLLPGVALLPGAEALRSLALLICGTVVTGSATMLAYRGSLEVVNEMAPPKRRGEIISTYILFMYAGNSLPIVGIGLLSGRTSSLTADTTFAVVIAALALLALLTGATRLPHGRA